MINVLELHLQNFRSWKELHLTGLNELGLCSIQGDNGSGKSSIRQAIEYLLTDTISDNIDLSEIPFNKDTQATMSCILNKDGKKIVITKVRDNKRPANNTIEVKVDGDSSLTTTSRKETQKNIEMLLGINKDVLTTSMIFSQYAKSFPEAKESERKAILYDALNLHKYNSYLDVVDKKLSTLVLEDKKLGVSEIPYFEKQIAEYEDEVRVLQKRESYFHTEIEKKIEAFQEEAISITSLLIDVPEPIDNSIEKEATRTASKLLMDEYKDLPDQLERISKELVLNKQKLDSAKNSTCPILKCVCSLLEENTEKIKAEVIPLQKPLQATYDELREIQTNNYAKLTELNKLYSTLEAAERIRADEIKSINQERERTFKRLEQIEQEIKKLKAVDTNPYTQLIVEKKKKIRELRIDLELAKEKLKKIEEEEMYLTFWHKGFHKSGIPNMKVEGFLSSLEELTNKYLSSISDRMFVEITSQRDLKSGGVKEEISYKVYNPDKSITDYFSYSGGEKQRVKIANILAFSDLLGQMDIIILDEVLELSLDEDGKSYVIDMLREKANNIGTIFVVTHSSQIQDKLDNIIRVKKEDGVSSIQNK